MSERDIFDIHASVQKFVRLDVGIGVILAQLFPIILLLISGLRQNRRRTVIILLAVVSFVYSVWQVAADPTAATSARA